MCSLGYALQIMYTYSIRILKLTTTNKATAATPHDVNRLGPVKTEPAAATAPAKAINGRGAAETRRAIKSRVASVQRRTRATCCRVETGIGILTRE